MAVALLEAPVDEQKPLNASQKQILPDLGFGSGRMG
jgi:hypothetical protein